jgi:hypothetical protein
VQLLRNFEQQLGEELRVTAVPESAAQVVVVTLVCGELRINAAPGVMAASAGVGNTATNRKRAPTK